MAIKNGYKQTDIGIIPEDWKVKNIKEIGKVITGSTPSKANESFWNGSFVWISAQDFKSKYIHVSENKITEEGKNTCRVVPKNSVLVTCIASIGLNAIAKVECATNQQINAVVCSNNFDNEFFYYQINQQIGSLKILAGQTAVPIINKGQFENFKLYFPPTLAEQTAIATALSDMDALVVVLDKKIAKKKAIKQGAMQQLLTGKKRLPGFNGKWVEKKLGEIARDIRTGKKNGDEYITDGFYPFYVRSKVIQRINTYSFEGEAILIPGEGGIGEIFHYISGKFDYHQRVYKISNFEDEIDGKYIYYYMVMFFGEYAKQNSVKATVDSLRLPTFENFALLISPTKSEQTAIARILSDMDNEIVALETKRDKYKQIKSGMMQELLTGKIRLVETVNKPQKTEVIELQLKKSSHNDQINEAVVISFLVHKFGTKDYPLSRFRYTKYAYLLHRQYEHEAKGFQKHAAGPYKPTNRYKGPENIAIKNKYILKVGNPKSGKDAFIVNEDIEKALNYFTEWYGIDIQQWIEQFRYYKNDYLEVLATVDESIGDLEKQKKQISVNSIKEYIHSISQWKEKLDKPYFSDFNIQKAIDESYKLFGE